MTATSLALKIGSQLIEAKLQKLAAGPMPFETSANPAPSAAAGTIAELPTTSMQKKERSAKVHPPRVITVR